jgi:glycolate oxidase FAD binding subunit
MTVDAGSLAAEIAAVAPETRALDPTADATLAVDGVVPGLWCQPRTAEEMGEVLRLANAAGAAVLPRGGGTRMALGMPPRGADVLLSTRGLDQIVEYEPADLTVTVQAGITFRELQRRLNAESQFLALDPPARDETTIGGIVASNASGPMRLHYGSARDLVIGIRVANADGVLTKAGGRVVKNVAGYDLNKLYTGSLGTVGVIVELSFKLHPLPRSRGHVVASFGDLDAGATLVKQVMRSPLGPTAIEALDRQAALRVGLEAEVAEGGCALVFLIEGFEKAVARVTEEIAGMCRASGRANILSDGADSERLWEAIRGLLDAADPNRPLLKVSVPPSRSIEALAQLRESLGARNLSGSVVAHAGVGLAYAQVEPTEWRAEALERLVAAAGEVRRFAQAGEGSLVIEACPADAKRRIDVWGDVGPPLKLMRAIKEQLDPRGTLNPGRFVGSI